MGLLFLEKCRFPCQVGSPYIKKLINFILKNVWSF